MSPIVGILSLVTSYFWWTIDWWRPPTFIGTKVGIEDFILGFAVGGIMAVVYEIIFKKGLYRKVASRKIKGPVILFILLCSTAMFIWGMGISTFFASISALSIAVFIMLFLRRDLFFDSVLSGALTAAGSLPFYYFIMLISPTWIDHTYLQTLSGVRFTGIPVEELIFWFFGGLLFGPLYEYWQGKKLRRTSIHF